MPTLIITLIIAVAAIATLGGVVWMLFNRSLLKLMQRNEEQRASSSGQVELGVKTLLESNHALIDRIAREVKEQLKDSQREVSDLKLQNSAIREQLAQTLKATETLHVSTEGLKNLLANNRLRGEWGEQVAEDLLLAAGFVPNVNYVKQATTNEGRPDFTILLPDGTKLNVDAKFPFDDLIAYQAAKTDIDKRRSLQSFEAAVKQKVKEITSKDYIDPEAQTCDFVVMFIPNEMIFSFIYEKLPGINEYCAQRQVVLAGPFGFTALVRLVLQAYKNFRYERGLHEILGLIGKFQQEYAKFGESFEKLGRQIEGTQRVFLEVEGTRNRQLTRLVERIGEHAGEGELPVLGIALGEQIGGGRKEEL